MMKRSSQLLFIVILLSILLLGGFIAISLARSGPTWIYIPTVQKSESDAQITPILTPEQTITPSPTTPPMTGTVTGTVLVEDGLCCIGGIAGDPLEIGAAFTTSSPVGEVTEMRVHAAGICADETLVEQHPWEPFVMQATYVYTPPINWSGFYISAQFRDEFGNVSPIVCDDISVEGMPSEP